VQFDDIHGGHGEAGAVDEAADLAVQTDVVQPDLEGEGGKVKQKRTAWDIHGSRRRLWVATPETAMKPFQGRPPAGRKRV
jgi:hypothetical protein